MVNWARLLDIVNNPEKYENDPEVLIQQVLDSLSSVLILEILSKSKLEKQDKLIPYLVKEIERRRLNYPPF
ncbi:hypothetical protein FHG64_06365 [Antarcticibacterium flavum]|uniref:Uncharacterized protein n=1 Tax=Antarcticibacterium flavum TaxID=2058175 RepID=A0A5B7X178_9FLAO|nr:MULTISPECIES: hypothetical protein [Antarcticibacterium]MCM4161271.1 hypothetical protein [Antarcticibacterium sp. W02-3]QCY69059.1 hypothetical protein FHG64_06365 [Antarcticibacterium flavum]